MNNELDIFKPGVVELQKLADQYKDLTINGVEDKEGYEKVKAARKELGEMRILITKTGKSAREEARRYANSVIEKEKEYLGIITPTEDDLKSKIEAIDEEKKIQERQVLLPSRIKMLEEIEIKLLDAEILRMDEKEFAVYLGEQKILYIEKKEAERVALEAEKKRAEEIEIAKAKAVEEAIVAERERLEKENLRIAQEALAKSEAIKAEQAQAEKNSKYKNFLKEHGYTEETKSEFYIERSGSNVVLYKKIGEITI